MHSFALVVAKPGRTVPPAVLDLLDERSPADLPVAAESHVRWSDDNGRTVYGGWQTGADHLGVGSHWEVRPDGLTAFSGHLWRHGIAWSGGSTWAAQLADRLAAVPLVASLEDFHGVYTAVSVSAAGDGCVTGDPFSFGALYWAESDDVFVVSTRSSLAARIVTPPGRRPARDGEPVASISYCTYVLGQRTGFVGVETIPPGSCVVLSRTDVPKVHTWSARPWLPVGDEDVDDLAALVERVRDDLAGIVRVHAAVHARAKIANLSGGRDSRLVLALLIHEGLTDQFVFNTFGSADLADTVVATTIADRFGLQHRASTRRAPTAAGAVAPPAAPQISYEDRLRHHVFMTSGLLSTWDLRLFARRRAPDMVLTGLFGEAYRTIYPGKLGIRAMDEVFTQVRGKGFGFDAAGIFKPEVRAHFDAQVIAALEAALPEGGTPQDALDGFYLGGRLRRWFGPQPDTETTNRVYPLYSLRATRAAFALGTQRRWSDVLMFELMRGTNDELTAMPFATSTWPEAAIAHLPDADRYRAAPKTAAPTNKIKRLLRPPTSTKSVNQEAQNRALDDKIPVLRAQLDLDANHPLFDLYDRTALNAAVERFEQLDYKQRRGVHGAVNTAMWLNEAEARYTPDT